MPETPTFTSAAVAAPHRLAAETGQTILAAGGNAVEAMLAMAAVIAVVFPHRNGLGGDGLWLVREPGGKVHAIDACGAAGSLATIGRYRDKGYDTLPPRGPDAALRVAGAVDGWRMASEMARAFGGRLPLDLLLGDAIRHARDGYRVGVAEANATLRHADDVHGAPHFADMFLTDGKTPAAGDLRRIPALGDALAHLAHAGLDDFYRGDVGREIAADLARVGSPVVRRDLEVYRCRLVRPLVLRRRDATLYNPPFPSRGLASLLSLGIDDRLGPRRADSVEHHHGLVEAAKRASAICDQVVSDPAYLESDPERWIAPKALAREADAITMRRASLYEPSTVDGRAAIWMGAVDQNGLCVSTMQSLYGEFGSGCVLPRTGILWSNSGLAFSLDPAARNALQPGRQPPHTLDPALAVFDDGRVLVYGAAGDEGHSQIQAQIFKRYADFGIGLSDAIDAPRWLFRSPAPVLKVEDRFDPGLLRGLSELGHGIEELGTPFADGLGHAGMVMKQARTGRVEATHDPRGDGEAMGL